MFEETTLLLQRRHRLHILFLLFVVSLLCLQPRLFAQSDSASVRGTVQDQTGAAVPGATIQLVNVDTGLAQKAVSNATGNFHFEGVLRGNYKATVTAPQFTTEVQNFALDVSQIQVLKFRLQPGAPPPRSP